MVSTLGKKGIQFLSVAHISGNLVDPGVKPVLLWMVWNWLKQRENETLCRHFNFSVFSKVACL